MGIHSVLLTKKVYCFWYFRYWTINRAYYWCFGTLLFLNIRPFGSTVENINILWKRTASAKFFWNRPNLSGNSAFPHNFHTWKLDEMFLCSESLVVFGSVICVPLTSFPLEVSMIWFTNLVFWRIIREMHWV